jgi:hypothetical protein
MGRAIPSCPESAGSPVHADDTNYTIIKNDVVVSAEQARQSALTAIGSSFATALKRHHPSA